ncbi:HAMP domain-containing histidine kinase [Acidobacteria bacterium AH-259-L09]|nr:HAMP domain-containing histidine kinase [Acidobacteria bacterium AH-259-L09]
MSNLSPRTKIFLLAILLILLPGTILSYLGFRSVHEKADNLETHYRGTVSLVRDKIEREVLRQQEAALSFLENSPPPFERVEEVKGWLHDLVPTRKGWKHPFLVKSDGGVVSTRISLGWSKEVNLTALDSVSATPDLRLAEASEWVGSDFSTAVRLYKKLLASTASPAEQAFLFSRLGRCFFKLGKYREGIREYRKVLSLPHDDLTPSEGIPCFVVALSQIADGHAVLKEDAQEVTALVDLYQRLLRSPWDLQDGSFPYYLESTVEKIEERVRGGEPAPALLRKWEESKQQEGHLLEQMRFIEWADQTIIPQIQSNIKGSLLPLEPHHISAKFDNETLHLAYVKLPPSFQKIQIVALGYQIEEDHILSALLQQILTTVDLGKDLLVGILDQDESVQYLQEEVPGSDYLVAQNFSGVLPVWKVALFHREGKSIEELVGSEKKTYLVLFLAIVLVMVIGIVFTVHAAAHEVELSRMKSEFVSNVSHDLKTPLALIRMFGETLETGLVQDEAKRQEFYRIIRKESERLTHLINNVLDFSKVDAGRKEYTFEEADVVEIVRNTVEAYKFHIRDLGFTVDNQLPSDPVIARVDQDAISQALLNLLDNATRYSEEGKYIGVRVSTNADWIRISVQDQGVGIAKDQIEKIFEKFYRGPTRKLDRRGSGLGLTLVKHGAEAHGGTVEVQSEEGKGSTFSLKIPWQQRTGKASF